MKTITKYNGKPAFLNDCRKIKGEFYEKDIDCFFVDHKWNRIDNGLIAFDYRDGKWKRKASFNFVTGYVDSSDEKKTFTVDENVINKNSSYFLNENVLMQHGYVESINSEKFLKKEQSNTKGIGAKYGNLSYNLKQIDIETLSQSHKEIFKKDIKDPFLSRFLKDYTFGLEFETSNGYIRNRKLQEHGVKPLLDGSLRKPDGTEPFEFTTIPYSSTNGVATIKSFCEVLDLHCEFDLTCSLHIHLGGFAKDRTSVLKLYKVLQDIQPFIFKMFPKYKKNPNYIDKRKNYCQFLPTIKEYQLFKDSYAQAEDVVSSRIFTILTGKQLSSKANFKQSSSLFEGTSKWHISGRYMWVNIIPLLFGKSETVEFRIHEPTFNPNLVINWLLMTISILEYAKNTDNVLTKKVTLEDIFKDSIYGSQLSKYYRDRVSFYNKCNSKEDYKTLYSEDFKIVR